MKVRQLIEALFETGAAFFDTAGKGFLSSSGAVYLSMDLSDQIADVAWKFVDIWSRGKPQRNQIMKNPTEAVEFLVNDYGLAAVFVAPNRILVLSKNCAPLKLSHEHQRWLEEHFSINGDEEVVVVSSLLPGYKRRVMTADVALFGNSGKVRGPEDEKFAKWKIRGPEDEEFSEMVRKRELLMHLIKGGSTNPQAKTHEVK
jgi:hypothetical protein